MNLDVHEITLIKNLVNESFLREEEWCKLPNENEIVTAPAFETCCLVVSNDSVYHFPVAWSPSRGRYSTFGASLPPQELFRGNVKLFFNNAFEHDGIVHKAKFIKDRLHIENVEIFVANPENTQSIVFTISNKEVFAWELVNGVYTNIKILELEES